MSDTKGRRTRRIVVPCTEHQKKMLALAVDEINKGFGHNKTVAEWVREAIREKMENDGNILGSVQMLKKIDEKRRRQK